MNRYKESIIYIIFTIVLFIFTIVKTYPKIFDIINIEKDMNSKKTQCTDLEQKLDALKKAEEQKTTITGPTKKIYKPEIPGSDQESSFSLIFDDIIDMAKYNGLKIYAIEYVYNPQDDEFIKGAPGRYNVCQVNMQVVVDYQDLESFIKDIYKYPYLINIDKVELMPYSKNKKILLVNMQLKLYSQL